MTPGDIYLKKVKVNSKWRILKGAVIAVYPAFYVVDFGIYRECFSNIVDKGM